MAVSKPSWRAYMTSDEKEAHQRLDENVHYFRQAIQNLQQQRAVIYQRVKKRRDRA